MNSTNFIPLQFKKKDFNEMKDKAREFRALLKKRRTVREFSAEKIPREIIIDCIKSAGFSPSGANKQPWFFAIVENPEIKSKIRKAAEKEEREFYGGKAPEEWLDDLKQFGTNEKKEFLETAPCLIVIFEKKYDLLDGKKRKNYYVKESVGIATGTLITDLHYAGLASLTHTPSPMNFLNEILDRPANEKPFLILVVGFPAENASVPVIEKKSFDEIAKIY